MLTGHTGFKGTWMTLFLESHGIPVVGFSLPPNELSLYSRLNRKGEVFEKFGDIRLEDSVDKFISDTKPSVIIHMAAQPLVLESYKDPIGTFSTNVMGTANLLNSASKSNSVMVIGVVTTDKVYRNINQGKQFIESDPLGGKDPYSASKVGTEAVISAWQQIAETNGGPTIISLRAGNVIGGGDWGENRLIPDLVRGFVTSTPLEIRNPQSTRPWQHVLDPLNGYLLALDYGLKHRKATAFNFGPIEPSLTVKEVIDIARQEWPMLLQPVAGVTNKNQESNYLDLNSNFAQEILGWNPVWPQIEAVQKSITWWRGYLVSKTSPQQLCIGDIQEFTRALTL